MLPDQRSAECAPAWRGRCVLATRSICRVVCRKQDYRGLKNGRAEGGAAEADGKDVRWSGTVVQQVVTALGWETTGTRNTKRARQVTSGQSQTCTPHALPEGSGCRSTNHHRLALGAEFLRGQASRLLTGAQNARRPRCGRLRGFAATPILIARAKQGSYVIVNPRAQTEPQHWPAVGGTARLLDDDLLPLHFRGTSHAPVITMPAVHQASLL